MKVIMILLLTGLTLTSNNAVAGTAYLTGERSDGMMRICYYDYMGSTIVFSIPSTRLCPLTQRI